MSAFSAPARSARLSESTDTPARQWLTLTGRRTVLVVAHTVTYVKRLLDVVSLLESDFRIQVVFTVPPHELSDGTEQYLRRSGGVVLPWKEAARTDFDLAIAAGPRAMDRVRARVVLLPHGACFLKRFAGAAGSPVFGLRREDLVPGGKLPAAVVLAHEADRDALARSCPEALPVAHVIGDPAHDRITTSLPERDSYRRALGLREGQRLIAVTSTWGPESSFARFETLLPRLIDELRADIHRLVVLVHPNVWSGHGSRQVRAWLASWTERGLGVVPPDMDWRPVLCAADLVIGDHGSVTLYATLTEAPIILAGGSESETNPVSPAAELALLAPALSPFHPLTGQFAYAAAEYHRPAYEAVAARITSEPGRFNRGMRALLYRLLGLGQPAHDPLARPLPPPDATLIWPGSDLEVPA
ncbi:hypothetical protein PV416_23755 [Streptomyces ipomoeae]|uniref:hypothetical protein n=1 Tax=Streptomyces ipomoeae TaxID=103232 RepID=UPI0029A8555F|nr:hypothetical protein [Streptomyces ipomoeae]MDX2824031.1 hypothetical protein [Streptomyces ipomoeae]MDX2876573.1 hypothetical protein [Streptomyces ipomoeae]